MPGLRELRAREGEVGGEPLGVHGAARHLLPLVLERLVVGGAPVAGEEDERVAAGHLLDVREHLDQAERHVLLPRVAPRAEDTTEAGERVRVVGAILAAVADGQVLVGVRVHDREVAVAHDEEARGGSGRRDGRQHEDRQERAHHLMKALTSRASVSRIRILEIGIRSGGSRSGSNHAQASDSGPQAIVPPVIRHSKHELT